jgi:serine/threonine-protein kinase
LNAALAQRYRLERELGAGGMATVYLARDLKHDRQVALKVLRQELTATLGAERFQREIQIAARLQHPHILPLLDSGEAGGFLYYAMPYIGGPSLRESLSQHGELPLTEAVRILRDVADALAAAHAKGVVHRDIKPENIMLSGRHALVADFGVAKAVSEATGGQTLTTAGMALGTPTYMAPEQVAADPHTDHRADLYAFGVMAYEMLTGQPPFLGATPQAVLSAHVTEPPVPVTQRRATIPPPLAQLIMRCLAKKPADRPQTAEELLPVLETLSTRSGGITPTDAQRVQAVPAARSRWRRLALFSVAAVVVVAGALLALRRGHVAPSSNSVAVLYLANLSRDTADAFLADGLTEEIIIRLGQVPRLAVKSRFEVQRFRGRAAQDPAVIGKALGAAYLVTGGVERAGNRVVLRYEVIRAATGAQVGGDVIDKASSDLLTVESDIAREVATAITGQLLPEERARLARPVTSDPVAFEAYLHGRYLLHRRTPDGLRGAVQEFNRAIGQDSAYAPAYAGLASAYLLWATYDYAGQDLHAAYGRAAAAASRGIALDSGLAEAYAARGYVGTYAWAPSSEVAADFRQALKLQPSSADVHGWYAHFLSREQRHDSAVAEAERAIALDPLAPGARVGIAFEALGARRYDIAAREAERAVALEPGLMLPRAVQGLALLLLGDVSRCATISMGPDAGVRAMCLYALGRKRESAAIIDSLQGLLTANRAGDSVYSAVIAMRGIATYNAWTGNAEQALAWLERAYEVSPEGEDFRVIDSGIYDPVRNDPRFRDGLERLRAQVYSRFRQETLRALRR